MLHLQIIDLFERSVTSYQQYFWRVRKVAKNGYQLRHVCPSVRLSACNHSTSISRIFMKSDISVFFENLSRKFNFHWNRTTIKGTLHEDQHIFLIISRLILPIMRNISDKCCRENQNKSFTFNNVFRKLCRLRDNVGGESYVTGQATDDNMAMRIACWTLRATNTYSEYVILIAFPLPRLLHERVSMLKLYVYCLYRLYHEFGLQTKSTSHRSMG